MAYEFPRCQVVPQPEHQVSFQIDGRERLRWYFGTAYPRPFLYPLIGPSGATLTRMGHPGAPSHEHHQSIWFAHEKVLGINFWGNESTARIQQKKWLCYEDGNEEAVMAVTLDWCDGHDPRPLVEQELIVAIRPGPEGETFLELQSTFRPVAESIEFGKTNFGFLAVRVAKSLSVFFGGGQLESSEGAKGEAAIFGKPARWMDYSGPVPNGHTEGITYFDHPANPGQPTAWHVREDGWMCASPCLREAITTTQKQPLVLRYLLHAHRGAYETQRAVRIAAEFAARTGFEVAKSKVRNREYVVRRIT